MSYALRQSESSSKERDLSKSCLFAFPSSLFSEDVILESTVVKCCSRSDESRDLILSTLCLYENMLHYFQGYERSPIASLPRTRSSQKTPSLNGIVAECIRSRCEVNVWLYSLSIYKYVRGG